MGSKVKFRWVTVNGYGNALFLDNINLINTSATVAGIDADTMVCINQPIVFNDASQGAGLTYNWNFGTDASVASATTQGPHSVSYSSVGTKNITLNVSGTNGNDNTTYAVEVVDQPVADFTWAYDYTNNIMAFTSTSDYVQTIKWDFGDGTSSSNTLKPDHSYPVGEHFEVTLIVENPCGSDTMKTFVNTWPVGIDDKDQAGNLQFYPNPAQQTLNLLVEADQAQEVEVVMYDVRGSEVYRKVVEITQGLNKQAIDIDQLSAGVYIVKAKGKSIEKIEKLIVE